MPLTHATLGITGIADVVEFHPGPNGLRAFPVAYKSGRPKGRRADEVQLCAQALCLEDMLNQCIPAGALLYGETRRRTDVLFDGELRQLTRDTIDATRAMLAAGLIPPRAVQASVVRCLPADRSVSAHVVGAPVRRGRLTGSTAQRWQRAGVMRYRPNRYGSSKSTKSCSAIASSIHAFTPGSARTRATYAARSAGIGTP